MKKKINTGEESKGTAKVRKYTKRMTPQECAKLMKDLKPILTKHANGTILEVLDPVSGKKINPKKWDSFLEERKKLIKSKLK